MKTLLAALVVLLLATPARASWELGPGLSAGLRPGTGGAGGMGTLTLAYRKSDAWTFAFTGGAGGFLAPADAMALIAAHARFTPEALRFEAFSTFIEAGVIHAHEIAWGDFMDSPMTATAGVCECIHHRTGLSLGAGVNVPLPVPLPISVVARAAALGLLPHMGLPNAYVEGALALSWRF